MKHKGADKDVHNRVFVKYCAVFVDLSLENTSKTNKTQERVQGRT